MSGVCLDLLYQCSTETLRGSQSAPLLVHLFLPGCGFSLLHSSFSSLRLQNAELPDGLSFICLAVGGSVRRFRFPLCLSWRLPSFDFLIYWLPGLCSPALFCLLISLDLSPFVFSPCIPLSFMCVPSIVPQP